MTKHGSSGQARGRQEFRSIDNIIKPIMDGLNGVAYLDDKVVERVIAYRQRAYRGPYPVASLRNGQD